MGGAVQKFVPSCGRCCRTLGEGRVLTEVSSYFMCLTSSNLEYLLEQNPNILYTVYLQNTFFNKKCIKPKEIFFFQ